MKKILLRIFNPPSKNQMNPEKDLLDQLILKNAVEVVGINNDGEILYSFTPKIKDVMPDLYKEHLNHVNQEVMNLWEKGFLNVGLFSDNPMVTLTKQAFNKEAISQLSKDEQWSLNEIKRVCRDKL
jgi:hypothetical protein